MNGTSKIVTVSKLLGKRSSQDKCFNFDESSSKNELEKPSKNVAMEKDFQENVGFGIVSKKT